MPYTNKIYGIQWPLAFGLPLVVLVVLIFFAGSAFGQTNTAPALPVVALEAAPNQGTLPAPIRARAMAAGKTYTRTDGTTARIGAPVLLNGEQYEIKDMHAQPSVRPDRSGKLVLGAPLPPNPDTRPFYRTLVWNDLMGTNIEYRAYMPGNTSFFKTELVVP